MSDRGKKYSKSFLEVSRIMYEYVGKQSLEFVPESELPKLLEGSRNILKQYLGEDTEKYDDVSKWFKRTNEGLRRIFSHHYQKCLVDHNPEKYDRIKFPERFLVIKDSHSKRLSRDDAIKFIDSHFVIDIDQVYGVGFIIDDPTYTLCNYTTFICEKNKQSAFENHLALDQMRKFCDELVTVDYTSENVHYEGGIVYVKDLKNKGDKRRPPQLTPEERNSIEKSDEIPWYAMYDTSSYQ